MHNSPNLKIWNTLIEGWVYPFRNLPLVARASILSLLFCFAVSYVGFLADYSLPFTPRILGSSMAFFATSHIAVGIHRAILLNETKLRIFRFGRPEILYLATLFLLNTVYNLPQYFHGLESWGYRLLGLLALLISAYSFTVLPAIAISERTISPKNAWVFLKGNRLRFLLIVFINMLLPWAYISAAGLFILPSMQKVLSLIIEYEISIALSVLTALLFFIVVAFCTAIILGATASVLSGIYKFIMQQKAIAEDKA